MKNTVANKRVERTKRSKLPADMRPVVVDAWALLAEIAPPTERERDHALSTSSFIPYLCWNASFAMRTPERWSISGAPVIRLAMRIEWYRGPGEVLS
jgi:hypothetical protein